MILKTLLPQTEDNLLTKQLDNQPTKTKGIKLQLIIPESVMLKSRWQLIIAVYLSAVYIAIAIVTKKLK